jgi:hypothetical protein
VCFWLFLEVEVNLLGTDGVRSVRSEFLRGWGSEFLSW